MLKTKRRLKILDFDIENRPLSYWYSDRPTAEITSIASCWADDWTSMRVYLLGKDDPVEMLKNFVERYNEADIVTGHYIRMHDLPNINGALIDYGLSPLQSKMTQDTKLDFIKKGDIPATQEFLSEMFDLPIAKIHMTQGAWREANRLTPEGLRRTHERVATDVLQHMALRVKMLELGLLSRPKIWNP